VTTDTFCAAPWTVYNINADGTVGLCCVQHSYKAPSDQHADFMNSQLVMDIKQAMLTGQQVKGCEKCYHAEASGLWSLRQWYNDLTEAGLDKSRLLEPGYENRSWYDLSLSNKCNQKCRICGPYNSTAWAKDAAALADLEWNHTHWDKPSVLFDSGNTIPSIIASMKRSTQALRVEMKGGEPLYLESSRRLLEQMVTEGLHIRTEELRIITNGTAYDDRLIETLKCFPALDIGLSIDATGKLHEYTRGTSMSWDDCRKSWETLIKLPNIKKLRVSNTIYAYTVHNLYQLREYVRSEFGADCQMADAVLHKPKYLHLKILPQHLLNAAADLLSPDDRIGKYLRESLNLSDITDQQGESLETVMIRQRLRFKLFTARLDAQRNERLVDYIPQLAELLS
jgi:organic radical activating enzyme